MVLLQNKLVYSGPENYSFGCDVNQYSSIFLISQYSPCTCKPLEAAVSVSLPKRVLYMYVVVWLCPLLKVADNSKLKKIKLK